MIDVLVVDDDFMVARIHRGYVERLEGFRVVGEVHTGGEVADAVQRLRPHLVLLDVYLPDRSGIDVLRDLRADPKETVDVIVVTAARDVDTVRAALHGGVASYLVKPFTFATFADRLGRYAEARREMNLSGDLAQEDVDRVFAVVRRPGPVVLPKGLSAATAALVSKVLQSEDGDLSAAETAERVGISRVSARRYLEHFCTTGQAQQSLRYGTSGRPEHRYRWPR
ncbi:MAG TPA: response regulator [Mycobacteriales bacterium]|nr:response regulator [Mycobacteriales bacterium]